MEHYKRRDFTVTCRPLRSSVKDCPPIAVLMQMRLDTLPSILCAPLIPKSQRQPLFTHPELQLPYNFQLSHDFALATDHSSVLYSAASSCNVLALLARPVAGHLPTHCLVLSGESSPEHEPHSGDDHSRIESCQIRITPLQFSFPDISGRNSQLLLHRAECAQPSNGEFEKIWLLWTMIEGISSQGCLQRQRGIGWRNS